MDILNRTGYPAPDRIPVFRPDLETATGGFKLDTTNLPVGTYVPAGSPMSFDELTRVAKVIKSATVTAAVGGTDTAIPVAKKHNFVAGEFLTRGAGGKAVTITSVDTSNANYDTINIDSAVGAIAAGSGVIQAAAASASTSKEFGGYSGLLKNDLVVATRNNLVDVVVKCTVYARRIPFVSDDLKAKLPLILFSNSK